MYDGAVLVFETVQLLYQDPFAAKAFSATYFPVEFLDDLYNGDEVAMSVDWGVWEENWVFDGGASCHMLPSASNRTTYIECRKSLIMAIGSTLSVKSDSSFSIFVQSSDSAEYVTLCNVQHVPSLH